MRSLVVWSVLGSLATAALCALVAPVMLLFGLDPSQIRIIMPDVGGGFGTKANYYVEQAVVAACALRFKHPVKSLAAPQAGT